MAACLIRAARSWQLSLICPTSNLKPIMYGGRRNRHRAARLAADEKKKRGENTQHMSGEQPGSEQANPNHTHQAGGLAAWQRMEAQRRLSSSLHTAAYALLASRVRLPVREVEKMCSSPDFPGQLERRVFGAPSEAESGEEPLCSLVKFFLLLSSCPFVISHPAPQWVGGWHILCLTPIP
jgi:hypothetical protein